MGPGYTLIDTPTEPPHGAIREAARAELTIGIGVNDLDHSLTTATDMGATVVMPATDNGFVKKAQITDPAGFVLTLIETSKAPE